MAKFYSNIVKLYAESLFSFAKSGDDFIVIKRDIEKLHELFSQQEYLIKLMSAPIFKAKEQFKIIDTIVKNYQISELVTSFLRRIALNNRLSIIFGILDSFILLDKSHQGIKMVEVELSKALTKAEQKKLNKLLEDKLNAKVEMKIKVKESILGGIIIKVDNKMYDASLRSKFINLNQIVENRIAVL